MKKLLSFLMIFCSVSIALTGQDPQAPDVLIAVRTQNTDLVFKVNGRDGRLYQSYLGSKLGNIEDCNKSRDTDHVAYATFGTDNLFEPAIRMTHNDGNPSLELKYQSHHADRPDGNTTVTHINLTDPEYPVEVTLHLKAFYKENVI